MTPLGQCVPPCPTVSQSECLSVSPGAIGTKSLAPGHTQLFRPEYGECVPASADTGGSRPGPLGWSGHGQTRDTNRCDENQALLGRCHCSYSEC